VDKHEIIRALAALIEAEIERATESANRTRQGAVHEEARPENDKDTRALEASYLARGQALRVVDLESLHERVQFMDVRAFSADDEIGLSALVLVESEDDDSEPRWYLLAPAGGGRRVEHAGVSIDVITPEAPLGRALIGRVRGDDLQLRIGARVRELHIADVR
jgi:transcription elongation GreA/GreB family factor